ncbi:hypothetical protein BDW68DRAFT_153814 [Aspergillus falconensis]
MACPAVPTFSSNCATEATGFRVTARPLPKLMRIMKLRSSIAARTHLSTATSVTNGHRNGPPGLSLVHTGRRWLAPQTVSVTIYSPRW